ncbi:CLUMA_CG008387, isoform A [Clunio marinus]|uniref:CLUMA_CG008387, isoform A n=1 Tax=Clunio marinus TaxID=568069 RepID=A0A1J1I3I2_9DIPT|nr:CLUMA_CG008387, isoform A [Clunio marinus]
MELLIASQVVKISDKAKKKIALKLVKGVGENQLKIYILLTQVERVRMKFTNKKENYLEVTQTQLIQFQSFLVSSQRLI